MLTSISTMLVMELVSVYVRPKFYVFDSLLLVEIMHFSCSLRMPNSLMEVAEIENT